MSLSSKVKLPINMSSKNCVDYAMKHFLIIFDCKGFTSTNSFGYQKATQFCRLLMLSCSKIGSLYERNSDRNT